MWWLWACSDDAPPRRAVHSAAPVPVGAPAERSILLVSLDTTRRDHLGAYGERRPLTPAIDRFGATARRYTQARSAAPWTKPAMGSVMTNLLPADHGVTQWEDTFAPDQVTLATVLHDRGFRTEAYVSHVAFKPQDNRFQLGFDEFHTTWTEQPEPGTPTEIETSTYLTDAATAALARLAEARAPFFLWVHYVDPHDAYLDHHEPVELGHGDAERYAEEIAWTDGQLRRLLREADAHEALTVVLLADHGEELLDHGGWGHTHTVYEELVHVPLLVRHPELPPGVDDTPVGTVDLAPTILWAVGEPPEPAFPGSSFLPSSRARPVAHETRRVWNVRGYTDWPWKGVYDLDAGTSALYDLSTDPGEATDRSADAPAVRERIDAAARAIWPGEL